MKLLTRIDRISRSLLTLNRDREYKTLKQMLALSSTDHALDVGGGDGFWTARFATHCGQITGLDPDERLLEYARTLAEACRRPSSVPSNDVCHDFQKMKLVGGQGSEMNFIWGRN